MKFIEVLKDELGVKAIKKMKPMQPGDVKATFADTSKLNKWINYKLNTSFAKGINLFAKWFKDYYKSNYYKNYFMNRFIQNSKNNFQLAFLYFNNEL